MIPEIKQDNFDGFLTAISEQARNKVVLSNNATPKPFVKWGGKRAIMAELLKRLPSTFNRYYEPFLGGGALLFEMQTKKAFVSDINQELILTYLVIKNSPVELMKRLDQHKNKHSEKYYYQVRADFNYEKSNSIDIASRFIYLNKTCYNGMYRVNKSGQFNVPFGKYLKEKVNLYDHKTIIKTSEYFQNVSIKTASYLAIEPLKGDLVYFDPPYHKTFTQYTDKDFNCEDQTKLSNFIKELSANGVKIMLSNSDTDLIRELYCDFNIHEINAPRFINCKGDGRKGKELIITNY